MKIDLRDTTFIIPVRVDTVVRLENLIMNIEYLLQYFDAHIVVLEAASYNNGLIEMALGDRIVYRFIEDQDPVYYKTKYLNIMAREVHTDIVGIWDVDVIVDYSQIIDAIQQLRQDQCDVAYPYDGDFLDTSDILRRHYMIHRDLDYLRKNRSKMMSLYTVEGVIGAVGGGLFVKTAKYLESGMDNEAFYGWGLEDGERHYRWLCLDYRIYRTPGCMYHLTHPRDINGMFRSKVQQNKAIHDMNEVVNFTKEELFQNNPY
ncbi:galactosyltransferase-related protein [Parabacteroides sp. PF5-9]|uniref:galactosyltransferase-related protein n=1 Tax=Parabacteroides sp. PF5-9 TaxID=1742404 RepID=UPI0024756B1B|nr:galactosyltransferase-related protein [Parabacteroides sp. PF5-9]MDH6359010.1 hypothetical protein [Parabacteroides sp. PF5-9]